jgi:regulator of protease activity HflC (stomatin/prohibitin superfamily)
LIAAIIIVLLFLAVTAVVVVASSVRVLREYERGVVFRLGRVTSQRGPGLIFLTPVVDRMVRVSLRTVTFEIPPQEIITRDNVPARVTAVAYYRVIDSTKSVVEVENVRTATLQIAQTTLRSVLGKVDLDALLADREQLNEHLQQIIDDQTEPWGVKVTAVEIKDVEIPERMQHAMARQAEAERERRAKIINAEGEFQAAARLTDAADVISRNPVTIQLRYLQTLTEVSNSQSSTIVFPLPIDVIQPLLASVQRGGTPDGEQARVPDGEQTRLDDGRSADGALPPAGGEAAALEPASPGSASLEPASPEPASLEPASLEPASPEPASPERAGEAVGAAGEAEQTLAKPTKARR